MTFFTVQYVSNREHLPAYMKARDAAVGQLPPVASTLMIVDGFSRPEFLVEVEAIAACGNQATKSICKAADGGAAMDSVKGSTSSALPIKNFLIKKI